MVLLLIEKRFFFDESNCRTSSANRLFFLRFVILHGACSGIAPRAFYKRPAKAGAVCADLRPRFPMRAGTPADAAGAPMSTLPGLCTPVIPHVEARSQARCLRSGGCGYLRHTRHNRFPMIQAKFTQKENP
jgi:hypothetical protein